LNSTVGATSRSRGNLGIHQDPRKEIQKSSKERKEEEENPLNNSFVR
jgi:hypothetical protein